MTPRQKLEQDNITKPGYEALKAIVKRHGITFVNDALFDIARDQATVSRSPDEAEQWRTAGVVPEVTRHELSKRNAP